MDGCVFSVMTSEQGGKGGFLRFAAEWKCKRAAEENGKWLRMELKKKQTQSSCAIAADPDRA